MNDVEESPVTVIQLGEAEKPRHGVKRRTPAEMLMLDKTKQDL